MNKLPLTFFLIISILFRVDFALLSRNHLKGVHTPHQVPLREIPKASFLSKQGGLGSKILVGYWHNFDNGIGILPLSQVSDDWDVIDVSFGETGDDHATVGFTPCYGTVDAFKAEIQGLQAKGKKVILSLGGQNGIVEIPTEALKTSFINSIYTLVDKYGFNGIDVDLEHGIILDAGDTDFKNPKTPHLVNLISALHTIKSKYGDNFLLTMAPEIAYVQGGISAYGGVWGAYLPIIYGVRDILTVIHVQHYNAGGASGKDGMYYQQGTADFEVAMADALLSGFPVAYNNNNMFPALKPEQVAIGIPANKEAAPAGGYITPTEMIKALNYLIKGVSFGGKYPLSNPSGYANFRGVMTWSINWDKYNNFEFSKSYRAYFGGSGSVATTTSTSTTTTPSTTTSTTTSTSTTPTTTTTPSTTTSTTTTPTTTSTTSSSTTTNPLTKALLSVSTVDASTGSFTITAVLPTNNLATTYSWYEGGKEITVDECSSDVSPIKLTVSNKAAGTYTYWFALNDGSHCASTSISVTVPAKTSTSTSTTTSTATTTTATTSGVPNWAAGTAYKVGDLVMYNGVKYQCINPHTAIVSWEPSGALSLWKKA